uniref:V(D)J recombination-activating protein 1 n=1 Tax=Neogobius melanostomus TaxID=47308 RepID=A0A8C6SSG1_9GOBI
MTDWDHETDGPRSSVPDELSHPQSEYSQWKLKLFRVRSIEKAPCPSRRIRIKRSCRGTLRLYLCRLCGTALRKVKGPAHDVQGHLDDVSRTSLRKMGCRFATWPEVIHKVFKVDVTEDIESVHPLSFCHRCWMVVIRGGGFCSFSRTSVPEWKPHSSPCNLCSPRNIREEWVRNITHCQRDHLSAKLVSEGLPVDFLFAFTCAVCDHLLSDPLQSPCGHLFCRGCIAKYTRALGPRCPACNSSCTSGDLTSPAKNFLSALHSLPLLCPRGCSEHVSLDSFKTHCLGHELGDQKEKPRQHLLSLTRRAQKHRLKGLKNQVKAFAIKRKEHRQADELEALMQGRGFSLHPAVCLAIRVNTFLSCSQYHKMYRTVKATSGRQIFQPLHSLRAAEKELLPGFHDFEWQPALKNVSPCCNVGIINGLSGWTSALDDAPADTITRRFRYDVALVSALKDLEEDIMEGLRDSGLDDSMCTSGFNVMIKESCDGMGDVSEKHGGGPALPEKAVRFSFTVMSVTLVMNDKEGEVTIFTEPKPNSELSCKPLCLMFVDESDHETLTAVLSPIVAERNAMQESRLILSIGGLPRSLRFHLGGQATTRRWSAKWRARGVRLHLCLHTLRQHSGGGVSKHGSARHHPQP